ncbi:hypothetical protein [Bdellovibrio sp. BCCA]|uniref:hypothetical protein n=1 Tax=Bdellovibrio sp. BCCA TaxID=3136281 RepID=UPI0030F18D4E
MKKSNAALLVALSVLNVTFFQNCAPNNGLQFSIDANSAYNIYGDLPPNAQVVSLKPEESKEYPSTQLVLVIDNSATMKQSQEALAEKAEKLLTSLSSKKVTVHLLTTSSYISNTIAGYGMVNNGVETYVKTTAELTGAPENQVAKLNFGTLNPTNFVLNPTDSETARQTVLNKIRSAIKGVGIGGIDQESGLCSVIQFLSQTPAKLSENEKTVVFLLTDEDNYAVANHCKKETVNTLTTFRSYTYSRTMVEYEIAGEGYTERDGVKSAVQALTFTDRVGSVIRGVESMEGQNCATEDANAISKSVAARVGTTSLIVNTKVFFNSAHVASCKYKNYGYGFSTSTASENAVDYCVNPYRGSANMMQYLALVYTGVAGTQACRSNTQYFVGAVNRAQYYLNSGATVAESFLKDLSASKMGSNFFMSIVTNIKGQSCALNQGQSYGDSLVRLSELSPFNIKTYSICPGDDTFTDAFEEIAAASTYVSQEFDLTIPEDQQIRDVILSHADGTIVKLKSNVYEVHDGKINFKNIKLSASDSIKVVIF